MLIESLAQQTRLMTVTLQYDGGLCTHYSSAQVLEVLHLARDKRTRKPLRFWTVTCIPSAQRALKLEAQAISDERAKAGACHPALSPSVFLQCLPPDQQLGVHQVDSRLKLFVHDLTVGTIFPHILKQARHWTRTVTLLRVSPLRRCVYHHV